MPEVDDLPHRFKRFPPRREMPESRSVRGGKCPDDTLPVVVSYQFFPKSGGVCAELENVPPLRQVTRLTVTPLLRGCRVLPVMVRFKAMKITLAPGFCGRAPGAFVAFVSGDGEKKI
jgi:hypothetical protein